VTSEFPGEASNLNDDGTSAATSSSATDEWVLVDGTPASCAQLGLHHLFTHRGPVDLVVSGPNFGRNTSALYALSSGTLGGALEAAACRIKAVGLSFAYDRPRNDDPNVIMAASRHSVRIIQHLWENWGKDVDLYSVNVPVQPDVENEKVIVTFMIQNRWAEGQSCFQAVDAPGAADGNVVEERDMVLEDKVARERRGTEENEKKDDGYRHRYYEWAPSHASVRKSAEEAPDGADGKVLTKGWTR
jgi:tubulin---tyrosine ligase